MLQHIADRKQSQSSQIRKMRYRLALDLGTSSIGWAILRLDNGDKPSAVIKAGVRIFSDGRNPKDGSSLAVTRRNARLMRRRRDRMLQRKARMMRLLTEFGFFPSNELERKALERLDPYHLRAKGLDEQLSPAEFARALFHINQRRGFQSNRKTDKAEKADADVGALKGAIERTKGQIDPSGKDGLARTVGEWLYRRHVAGDTVRARFRETKAPRPDGKNKRETSYDLYVDRAMVEAEFDQLWATQAAFNPQAFHEAACVELKDCLLFQRKLRAVKPGRCTLNPFQERAPLALPSQQRVRILQEVNNLRVISDGGIAAPLSLEQRDRMVEALERNPKRTFGQLKTAAGLASRTSFNLEDEKRDALKGNQTSCVLRKPEHFGALWDDKLVGMQDEIVRRLIEDESEAGLVQWLIEATGVTEAAAERIAKVGLPDGYGSLAESTIAKLLPELRRSVITYDKAVIAAGFEHHSNISHAATGEVLPALPYYGEYLPRHVGFGTNNPEDADEKRYGKIANPTVHIGLNQVRKVVNELIGRYGHPSEVIVEVARDLKQNYEQRKETQRQQAANQARNERLRTTIAETLRIEPYAVKHDDIQKMILWEELSQEPLERCCPYSGVPISLSMLLSDEVEVEHILPFSRTLDDSLNNKTVAMRHANRIKDNRTPAEAAKDFAAHGWSFEAIVARAAKMPRGKRCRFAADGYEQWLREDKDFLARALNDTRYLSRIAREYLALICPKTRVIPGQMTALLRAKFGLNDILGKTGEKNREDHRHHAVDACVIGVTDQGMLQRFAQASADSERKQLSRLVEVMPEPWHGYRDHVQRAVEQITVSFRPDHNHEGAMHNDTAYALLGNGEVATTKRVDDVRQRIVESLKVIEFAGDPKRHGTLPDGQPKPYKGYKGDSNYCIEIVLDERGRWQAEVISTFTAYQIFRAGGLDALRGAKSQSGRPLVMRLMTQDYLRLGSGRDSTVFRITAINSKGVLSLAEHFEANVDKRNRDREGSWRYTYKTASTLQKALARTLTVSPAGVRRLT